MKSKDKEILKNMFNIYKQTLEKIEKNLDSNFDNCVDLIFNNKENIVISGIGKSGLVGKKIAATLTSTGTPAIFMHPSEAVHGDLGIVKKNNIIILISNSGETEELIKLLPALKRLQANIISIVGNIYSSIARAGKFVLNASIDKEACPLNLAPTTSTLSVLALGDALAISLMNKRDFKPHDFLVRHPGGKLGESLSNTVSELMKTKDLPIVFPEMAMSEVIVEMTNGNLGLVIVQKHNKIVGLITDGDLRRMLLKKQDLDNTKALEVMNPSPITVLADEKISSARKKMIDTKLQSLVVTDEKRKILGIIQIF